MTRKDETMEGQEKKGKRYSLSFILEVITEVERGKISIVKAQNKYGIGGNNTIQKWIKKYGRLGDNKEAEAMKEQEIQIEKLKKEKQELESALAKAHLKIMSLETLVEVYQEDKEKGIKKSIGKKLLVELSKVSQQKGKSTQ
jgi:transposase-like protein